MIRTSLFCSVALLITGACADEGTTTDEGFADRAIVTDFADVVVVPTYELLAERASALEETANQLESDPSEGNLAAARAAWVDARVAWEQSEGFLFGPVDSFGYDPAMDSWPVNRTDLDAVLASGDAFTEAYVAGLAETQKGFHTIEYLLFGTGADKTAAELTARELAYLTAITTEFRQVAHELAASWTVMVDGRPRYRDTFATAGSMGNGAYPSMSSAAQEIVQGMIGIADEVANGKIADPYDAHDPTLVESQFSHNSLTDFQDNIRSIQNAYTAKVPAAGTSGRGLSAYVASIDSELDTRVRAEIQAALDALGAIPAPFRDAISNPEAYDEIEAAQSAIRKLQSTLETAVLPLVQ